MNQFKVIVGDFQKSLTVVPLPIAALILYFGLRSTTILPGGIHEFNGMYHPAYLGWYDFVLGYAIVFSFVTGALKLELKDSIAGLLMLLIISVSWVGTYQQDKTFIIDGIACFLRFFLVFVFAKSLVGRLGYRTAESVLLSSFGILSLSAMLWYSLQFGTENRMAASAMTPASFGQVSAVVCLIFYGKKCYPLLFYSFIFLFLSFSRTSILLFFLVIVIQNRKIIPLNLIKYILAFVLLAAIGIVVMTKYGGQGTEVVLESRFSYEEFANLNGRTNIWNHALELIEHGDIPLFGVGFHMTPSLIQETNLKFFRFYSNTFYIPPHFHNILIEYGLGLGVWALVIFIYLMRRIWQTYTNKCNPAFFIYFFFLCSQTIDYTIFTPKEIVIFALMLGLAEGQWTHESRTKVLDKNY